MATQALTWMNALYANGSHTGADDTDPSAMLEDHRGAAHGGRTAKTQRGPSSTTIFLVIGVLGTGSLHAVAAGRQDQGTRLLAALIASSAWLYLWAAFDGRGTGASLLSLASAMGAWGLALKGVSGGPGWIVVGFALHILWGVIHLLPTSRRNHARAFARGWLAFHTPLAAVATWLFLH